MNHPVYSKYKPSGIEWLGNVPKHWKVRKLKYISDVRPSNVDKKSVEGELPVKLCNYIDVYSNDHITSEINFMSATASQNQINKFSLKQCDVLITKDSEAWDDIAVPAYITENLLCVLCGYHLAHISPNQKHIYGNYLFRAFSSFPIRDQFCVAANGITRFGLSKNSISSGLFLVPPLDEQQAIADFLDRRTGEIDELIAKKEGVIELLREKRTALISHAVTKGLNPDAKMKDSGIDWLGEIPEHWEVKKLKYLVKEKLKYGANESAELDDSSLPRYIRITDFGDDGKLREDTFKSLPQDKAKEYLLGEGDILFARSGATVGKTFQFKSYDGIACFAGYLIKASPNKDKILSDFAYYYTKSNAYNNWKNGIFIQATIQNIGADKYQTLLVTQPSLNEQTEITDYLNRETSKIDALIAKVTEAIEKLKEYRTALISAAVTGKIKVF